jgi:outer membrane protein
LAAPVSAQTSPTQTSPTRTSPTQPQLRIIDLDTALKTGQEHAPELRQAAAASEAARARIQIAGAPLLPQLNGTASYARGTYNGPIVGQTTHDWLATRDSFSAGLRASQLIYDFGQTINLKHVAQSNALAQEQNEHVTELEISYNVRNYFLTAGANKALVVVAQATLANQTRHMEQIQGFVDVGTRPPIDLAQARTDVGNAKLALLRAENNYAIAKAQLSRAMGVPGQADYDVSDELPPPEPQEEANIEALMHSAESARPEFASLQAQLQAQTETLRAIKGQYGPSLNLVGSLDESGYKLNNLATNLSAGVSLAWPIFGGGITNGRVAEGNALLTQLEAQLDTLREDLQLAITQAETAIKTAQAALIAANELVELAKERVKLAEGCYAAGVGNTIELGDAELALRDAETQLVTAEYDLASARALLRRSLGER